MFDQVRDRVKHTANRIKQMIYSTNTVALAVAAAAVPGSIITLTASAYYAQDVQNTPDSTNAQCQIAVKSPIAGDSPVYLTQGWEKSNGLANGMPVRAFVDIGGQCQLVDGIQLDDGRIWVDGIAYERTDPPKS